MVPVPPSVPPPGDDDASHWHAVWTRSRHEQAVCGQLQQKAIESFLPTISRWSRWKDRKKKIDWPLFPGYCFARFPGATRMDVLKCSGVVTIVSIDGTPAPIPDHEIDSIRQLVESDLAYDPCPLIVGHFMMWREETHLTATYSKQLAPSLRRLLTPLLP